MNQYKQLTEGQRYQISALLKVETLQKDIALILGVSPPTISRELDPVIQGNEDTALNKPTSRPRGVGKQQKDRLKSPWRWSI